MFKTYFIDVLAKHYFDFKGRATRKQFWMFTLFNLIFVFVLSFLGALNNSLSTIFNVLSYLYSFAVLLPGLGIAVRRLHDINFRGWWILIAFVPFVGSLILLVFYVLPSKEPNRF